MKLLVFSTVIPTRKNLRVRTFETLYRAFKKRISIELIWVVYQPDKFKKIIMDDRTIYCIKEFSDGVDLLKKLNPDLVLVSKGKELIHYSASLASKALGIPLVGFSGAKIDNRHFGKSFENLKIETSSISGPKKFFQDKLPGDPEEQSQFLRRTRFFLYKYRFLIKTQLAVKKNIFRIIILLFRDFINYGLNRPLQISKLPDHYILWDELEINRYQHDGIPTEKISVVGNPLLDDIFHKIPTIKTRTKTNGKIKILILTDSLYEHRIWSYNERESFLTNLFEKLQEDKTILFDIKIHPTTEDKTYYQRLSNKLGLSAKIFQSEDLFDLINNYDIIITYGASTTHTELSLCGKKTILIATKHLPTFVLVDEAIAAGFIKQSYSFADLIPLIHDFHEQKINLTNEFIEQRAKYFYKFDGKSGDRAADSIIQFLETVKSKSN
jgi:hypothetical protein